MSRGVLMVWAMLVASSAAFTWGLVADLRPVTALAFLAVLGTVAMAAAHIDRPGEEWHVKCRECSWSGDVRGPASVAVGMLTVHVLEEHPQTADGTITGWIAA